MANNKILLVDDEPKVLSSLTRQLIERDDYEIKAAQSGQEGLELLKENPDSSVVVSDYHMPGMDGVSFLAEVQKRYPDITRIILTGAADLNIAVQSVNRGRIFRFLLKPCPMDEFIASIEAGIRQHQLITGERELLSKTLNGSVKVMVDILSALNPEIFAQASRLRELGRALAVALDVEQIWEVELAALLCRIGIVTIPPEVLDKALNDLPLSNREQTMLREAPRIGAQIVQNIPRLENIAFAIRCQDFPFEKNEAPPDQPTGYYIPPAGRILKIVLDYDRWLSKYGRAGQALQEMYKQRNEYDLNMLDTFRTQVLKIEKLGLESVSDEAPFVQTLDIENVEAGMLLMRDIIDREGRLVVSKGTVITGLLKERLKNYFWSRAILDQVMVGSDKLIP